MVQGPCLGQYEPGRPVQHQLQTLLRGSCGKLPAGNVFLPAPANDMVQM